jgi:hypothetical protein
MFGARRAFYRKGAAGAKRRTIDGQLRTTTLRESGRTRRFARLLEEASIFRQFGLVRSPKWAASGQS